MANSLFITYTVNGADDTKKELQKNIPDEVYVSSLTPGRYRREKWKQLDVKNMVDNAKTIEQLLHLANLQWKLAIYILLRVEPDLPGGGDFSYRIRNDTEKVFSSCPSHKDDQVLFSLFHMLNYTETIKNEWQKKNKTEERQRKLYCAAGKAIIGVRRFLRELTCHEKNPEQCGPTFDAKFVNQFQENPKTIKKAQEELTINFSKLFETLRLIPPQMKIACHWKYLPYYFVNSLYYKSKCKSDKDDPYLLELYYPNDMDDEIIAMNLEKLKHRNDIKKDEVPESTFKEVALCLNTDLLLPESVKENWENIHKTCDLFKRVNFYRSTIKGYVEEYPPTIERYLEKNYNQTPCIAWQHKPVDPSCLKKESPPEIKNKKLKKSLYTKIFPQSRST